jgi:hypothetical protein
LVLRAVSPPGGLLRGILAAVPLALLVALLVACGSPAVGPSASASEFLGPASAGPLDLSSPAIVLGEYLAAWRAGDCVAASRLGTVTFAAHRAQQCDAIHLDAYAVNPTPARPDPSLAEYAVRLTTDGSADGTVRPGQLTWFFSVTRQPDGTWRLSDAGSGP